jgi:plasmid stability protein
MMAVMTLRGIDDTMAKILKEKAATEGLSVNALMLKMLREALQIGTKKRGIEYNDLDALAGTWDESAVDEFERNTAVFEKIDESLWKNANKFGLEDK